MPKFPKINIKEINWFEWLLAYLIAKICLDTGMMFYKNPIVLSYLSKPQLVQCLVAVHQNSINALPQRTDYSSCEEITKAVGDKYTSYLSKEVLSEFEKSMDNKSFSTGLTLDIKEENNKFRFLIAEVLPGSPADRAGIVPGDEIIIVNGVSLDTISLEDYSKILDKTKMTVMYSVRSKDGKVTQHVLNREELKRKNVNVKIKENVALIDINMFSNDTYKDITSNTLIQSLPTKVDTIVVDLRDNPGGGLFECIRLGSAFVPKNSDFVTIKEKDSEEKHKTLREPIFNGKRVIIVVNENSASASELFSASVRELIPAKVVGVTSYGKGSVQQIMPLWGGGAAKVTIAKYYTPKGYEVDKKGVVPDVQKQLTGDLFRPDNFKFLSTVK
ncbi:MAG: S41 family peptidase [Patescibacteria group bacterium]